MSRRTPTYEEAVAQARASIGAARLADPGEHYPYKIGTVERLLASNQAMGPGGTNDNSVQAEDVMTQRIAAASKAYIDAQAAFLTTANPATHEAYEAAKDDLVAARKAHRRSRVDADGKPIGAVIGLTAAPAPEHQRGPRLRRVGEE